MAISPSFTGACVALFIAGLGHGFGVSSLKRPCKHPYRGEFWDEFCLIQASRQWFGAIGISCRGVLGDRVVGSFSPILVLLTALLAVAPVLTFHGLNRGFSLVR